MVCKFKVVGQTVTSEVRSLTQITKSRFRGGLITDEAVFLSIGVYMYVLCIGKFLR